MTRRLFLFATALMLIISTGTYGQKLQKSDISIQLPKSDQRQVMTSAVGLEGSEYWTGYWNGVVTDETQSLGVQQTPMNYGCAIRYEAGSNIVKDKIIKGVKFSFPDSKNIDNVYVFISTTLPLTADAADICYQKVTDVTGFQEPSDQFNEVRFDKPYTVDPTKDVYIGYFFDVTGGNSEAEKFPCVCQFGPEKDNSIFLSFGGGEWTDYTGSGFGVLAMQVLIDVPTVEKERVIFEESFANGIGNFTAEGTSTDQLWTSIGDCVTADGYSTPSGNVYYLVSPTINLGKENKVNIDYRTQYFAYASNPTEDMKISVRLVGGEWEDLSIPGCETFPFKFITSPDISIPEKYNNQDVQIALKYTSEASASGAWTVKNFKVRGVKAGPAKTDPQLSFNETEVVYNFGDMNFQVPVLNNPYNVDVVYTSSNTSLVYVDETGKLFFNEFQGGDVTITATSAETESFLAGSASYNIKLLVDPKFEFDVNEVTYNVGESFYIPNLYNPNYIFVTYSSSDESKVTVDPYTGAINILDTEHISKVTISATNMEEFGYFKKIASYVLTIIPKSVFNEVFDKTATSFTIEGDNGVNNNIWWFENEALHADAYGKIKGSLENRAVSPVIKLDAEGNVASFEYKAAYFGENIAEEMMFSIREVGGDGKWVDLKLPVCQNSSEFISTGDILIPSYFAGKKVQFGFKYSSPSSPASGIWEIRYFLIKKSEIANVKVDPAISFEETNVNYIAGDKFVAPKLNNYYGVVVAYFSSDNNIARAVQETGEIKFYGEGSVTITAKTFESALFSESVASYNLTITIPTGIEEVGIDNLEDAKIYDLQGRRVENPSKGIYIVNGKKVVIK